MMRRVEGFGFRVSVQGLGSLGFRVSVQGLGLGFRVFVQGLGLRASGKPLSNEGPCCWKDSTGGGR